MIISFNIIEMLKKLKKIWYCRNRKIDNNTNLGYIFALSELSCVLVTNENMGLCLYIHTTLFK